MAEDATRRRGRPRAGERAEREARVLDAATEELLASGYEGLTMLAIAKRAGASKETLYSWFGSKEGVVERLIQRNADASAARIQAAFETDEDPRQTLTGYATGLLALLGSPESVALNRAAMTTPALAEILLTSGRHRVGPIVEAYLERLHQQGVIQIDSSGEAFELLYGLVMQDTQIRVLLGERPPSKTTIAKRAATAVDRFLQLTAVSP